ncbi:TPA: hypothetical protein JD854_RS10195 [Citrobacter amalonaticus]|uniref:Thymidylate kinase n=1 Tax=Citrobacter amalonaticus TaxID=35703 RepID=A0A9C7V1P1_CITAM|nr:hypothetical protein [Citrobacter amalonaticus]
MSQFTISTINPPFVRVIAIVGCDGSGKSTLAASLTPLLASQLPTKQLYLGQSSGRIGEWIEHLPVIGASVGRYLRSKAARVHQRPSSPPGNVAALVIFLLSCWRAYKFRNMLIQSRQGTLFIVDRYPQMEVPGFRFDGPQLAKATDGNWWVRILKARELQLYRWMASWRPLLMIRLDIDEETAFSRKPDHPLSVLHEKIAVTPHLTFNGATILELNGREPADKILIESLHSIQTSLREHQIGFASPF